MKINRHYRKLGLRAIAVAALMCAMADRPARAQALYETVESGRSARSHRFDVLHIAASVRFVFDERLVVGSVRHRIRSLESGLGSIRLDAAANMRVGRVAVDGAAAAYEQRGDTLEVALPRARAYGDTFTVAIDYDVVPQKGLYFIAPDASEPLKRQQIWTQGEDEDNRFWLPCYDYPNDRATSELRITVPKAWKALSNGTLVSTTNSGDTARTWHYVQNKPHSSYLIMLAAGDYLVTRDTAAGVPLEYWSYPDMPERVAPTFGRTPDMMVYFEKLLGVKYPWAKYAQVFIADFMYGGMENTTATTLNDYALVDERGFLDYNPDGLIAHELAHQWFGDLVTNRSWAHLWLHESYATYLEARYRGHRYGADVLAKEMYDNGQEGLQADAEHGRNPIAGGKGYTPNIYGRGARVLYMLNAMLGDEAFWRANRLFLERHAYGLVETNDLKIAFEDALGMNLDWFFEQWIYRGGAPIYQVDKSYAGDTLLLRVQQIHEVDSLTGLFDMPVPLEFHLEGRIVRDTVRVSRADQTFAFVLPSRPRFVIFDAGDVLLKTVVFARSDAELLAQLRAPRSIDRFHAVSALTEQPDADPESKRRRAEALRDAFMAEGVPYVRQEIVEKIGRLHPELAAQVVARALRDTAADIRAEAAGRAYLITDRRKRVEALRPLLEDRSYNALSAALGMIAATDTAGLAPVLRKIKGVQSRRDRLAGAWLNAVVVGRFDYMADDVVDYTATSYRDETRALAYTTLSRLSNVTPKVRAAIVRGLADQKSRATAAIAARAHLDAELRALIQLERDRSAGELREYLTKFLE